MRQFSLQIVTPDGTVFDGKAESLLIRTTEGDMEFLAGHVDYTAALGTGRARITVDGVKQFASCSGGFMTVIGGQVRLAPVTFEFAEDIDLERAKRAKEAAEQKIKDAKDEVAMRLAKAKLTRALSRIKIAEQK